MAGEICLEIKQEDWQQNDNEPCCDPLALDTATNGLKEEIKTEPGSPHKTVNDIQFGSKYVRNLPAVKGIVKPRKTSGKPQKRLASAMAQASSTASSSRDPFEAEKAGVDNLSPRPGIDPAVISPKLAKPSLSKRQCLPSTPVSSKRSSTHQFEGIEGCIIDLLKIFRSMASPEPAPKKTINDHLGLYIVSILESLPPAKQNDLRLKLMQCCCEAETDNFSQNSSTNL